MNPDTPPASDDIEATTARVRQALDTVLDPELGESIVALGLVQAIELAPAAVKVTLVPTSATCPMGDLLVDDATLAVQQVLPAGWIVEVDLDFEQQWSPQRLSPELREQFGWHDDQR
jgi:metal-sulfur cluster biosynthetic enzyme